MRINRLKKEIETLGEKYHKLVKEDLQRSERLLRAEIPEAVFNFNAFEGSRLSLKEVRNIVLRGKVESAAKVRDICLAKNLGAAMELMTNEPSQRLSVPLILGLHKQFLSGVDDAAAGQLRVDNRRAGLDLEPSAGSELTYNLLEDLIKHYNNDNREFLEKIAFFHAEFILLKPFTEGSWQIGQLLVARYFMALGYPPVIIYSKGKSTEYQQLLKAYKRTGNCDELTIFFALALTEALHKYTTVLDSNKKAMPLSKWAKKYEIKANSAMNRAKRQSIPAFRQNGRWQIDKDYVPEVKFEPWGDFISTPIDGLA